MVEKLLTHKAIENATTGLHADGGCLYLHVDRKKNKSWRFIYRSGQKRTELGLGSFPAVSLARAREKSEHFREIRAHGGDPKISIKNVDNSSKSIPTFGVFAEEYLESIRIEFRNPKHFAQWKMTLNVYAANLKEIPIDQIQLDHILGVLQPIWTKIPETASRLRQRIERILDAASTRELRSKENPARFKGYLDTVLPKRQRLTRGHHKAMACDKVAEFMKSLQKDNGSSAALALQFLILTAARSGEVIGAKWDEIDFEKEIWTIPKQRMKAKKGHQVPLSNAALNILNDAKELSAAFGQSVFVFPGSKSGKSLSVMAMSMVLRRAGRNDVTVHGFRSSFRDWAGDIADYPRELAEAALAHAIGNATEQAYRRGTALDKRRPMMEAWAAYCLPE